MKGLDLNRLSVIIDLTLAEDLGLGDVTTETLIPPELRGRADVLAKAVGVLAGGEVLRQVFLRVDPSLEVRLLMKDGERVRPGNIVGDVCGRVSGILKGERLAMNFLCQLSGIASLTAKFVAATEGLPVKIADTRKTTPGLRELEKYAVRMGGGWNHRPNLGAAVLIKDNHLAALRALGMSLRDIVTEAKARAPSGITVEVEVTKAEEVVEAVQARADIIMLDNMSPEEMRRMRSLVPHEIKLEASGGINLGNVREVALAGVDIISIGALTHSAPALDFSLELRPETISGRAG
jgi:nicotinate-nucleotide pyrophosphorylase (carboxylating)